MAGEFEHLDARLDIALQARNSEWGARHISALRLFNGFYEGAPHLVVDLYARTLVLYWYGNDELKKPTLAHVGEYLRNHLPWVECIIEKNRTTEEPEPRWGSVVFGKDPASEIREHDVLYAIDLLMNQDASFYLDTRMLRGWLLRNANGWQVLNTFAYTGSLGVAALAGGAAHVIQVDRNPRYLELARRSGMLNRLDIGKMKLESGDFFKKMAGFQAR